MNSSTPLLTFLFRPYFRVVTTIEADEAVAPRSLYMGASIDGSQASASPVLNP